MAVTKDGFGLRLAVHLDATTFEFAAQQVAGGGVELALHQVTGKVQHHHIHAAPAQGGGGFEAEQPPADHHRLRLGL